MVAIVLIGNAQLMYRAFSESLFWPPDMFAKQSLALNVYLDQYYFTSFGHFHSIALGVLIAIAGHRMPHIKSWSERWSVQIFLLGWAMLIGVMASAQPRTSFWGAAVVPGLSAIASAILVFASMSPVAKINQFRSRWVEAMALSSYSIYLIHPLGYRVADWLIERLNWASIGAWAFGLALGIAYLAGHIMFLCFERPIYALRLRFMQPRQRASGVSFDQGSLPSDHPAAPTAAFDRAA